MFSKHTSFTGSQQRASRRLSPPCHQRAAAACSSVVFSLSFGVKRERGARSGAARFATCPCLQGLEQEKYCGTSGRRTRRTKEKISFNFSFRINFRAGVRWLLPVAGPYRRLGCFTDSWRRKRRGKNKPLTRSSPDNLEQDAVSEGGGLASEHRALLVFKLLVSPGLRLISLCYLYFWLGKIILEQHQGEGKSKDSHKLYFFLSMIKPGSVSKRGFS